MAISINTKTRDACAAILIILMSGTILIGSSAAQTTEWSGATTIVRITVNDQYAGFDLIRNYPCGESYEYSLPSSHEEFASLSDSLLLAIDENLPVNVEYTGSGCSRVVVNITF